MERLARVASLWSWLPAFRAVAETENVHAAARALGVSPSSLSRAIRLLEAKLERPLFERSGGVLHLTPMGHALLAATRDAMRSIDDATSGCERQLRIAAPRDLACGRLAPALDRLRSAGSDVVPRVTDDPDLDPVGRLLRGELDLVIASRALIDRRLVVDALGDVPIGVYGSARVDADDLRQRPFVTYRSSSGAVDRWPSERPRAIGLEVDDPHEAALAAARGALVVALPDPMVDALALPLRRIDHESLPVVPLFAIRRRSLGRPHPADRLVDELRPA